MPIKRKPIKILSTHQSNRLLVYKPTRIRIIIPEEVVIEPRLMVGILVLQPEGVVRRSRYVCFALQFAPTEIIPEPNQIAVPIGHLYWDADLVAVEVVGLLVAFTFFVGPVVDLCQGFVTVGSGVDIGISAVRANASVTTV